MGFAIYGLCDLNFVSLAIEDDLIVRPAVSRQMLVIGIKWHVHRLVPLQGKNKPWYVLRTIVEPSDRYGHLEISV